MIVNLEIFLTLLCIVVNSVLKEMIALLTITLISAIGGVLAQNTDCDFAQNVVFGQTKNMSSPGYPQNYTAGVDCRWIAVCPSGYNCVINCTVGLPNTENCTLDRLQVSRSGDVLLSGAMTYCGNTTFTAVSKEQRLTVGLIRSPNSPGGRFLCDLYAQEQVATPKDCKCGYWKGSRIVGGQIAGVSEFPMMAGLAYRENWALENRTVVFCGGVIISNTRVLTAAHCVINIPQFEILIIVGAHNLSAANETTVQRLTVVDKEVHPKFNESAGSNRSSNRYDIAILTTNGNINFNQFVGPACLPFKFQNTNFAGSSLTVLGWGTDSATGPTSDVLQKVDVEVMPRIRCNLMLRALGDGGLARQQICTYSRGRDACQYDSGGPLLYTDPSTGLLYNIGVVSFGRFCAERWAPAVNTNVPRLLDWIRDHTPDDFCIK